jgi:hypothetical protein
MTAGRKPNPTPTTPIEALDRATLDADGAALTEVGRRSAEVSERFGDGLPYERSRIVSQARFFMGQSAEAMLSLGQCLIQLKENEPHGDFTEIVTERLGISTRSAQRMMQAALKYLSPKLASNATPVALLGKSKLFDLMDESDDDIQELAEGGTLAGLTLDDMASMTRRELQAALAESKKLAAAKDKVIAKKDAKINDLEQREELQASDESEALKLLRTKCLAAEGALAHAIQAVDSVLNKPPTQACELAARHSVDYLVRRLVDVCETYGIAVDLAEQVTPAWTDPINAAVDAAPTRKAARK